MLMRNMDVEGIALIHLQDLQIAYEHLKLFLLDLQRSLPHRRLQLASVGNQHNCAVRKPSFNVLLSFQIKGPRRRVFCPSSGMPLSP